MTNFKAHKYFSGAFSSKVFPIAQWLPNYGRQMFLGDLVSGLTVGLMAIPQGMRFLF
jgi:MFS superfamily sulfate permease-like transporter